jgi:hypothetical protein
VQIVSSGFEDAKARSCFDFFRTVTSHELSRFFDDGFWKKSVLQAGHEFTAVRHAIIAVGSLHQSYKEHWLLTSQQPAAQHTIARTGQMLDNAYATGEYMKAIREAVQLISDRKMSSSQDDILICSVLFIFFELLRSNEIAALGHLEAGIALLNQTALKQSHSEVGIFSGSGSEIEGQLMPLFSRLDIEASTYAPVRSPKLSTTSWRRYMTNSNPGWRFSTLFEASKSLSYLVGQAKRFQTLVADNYRYRWVGDIPMEVFGEQQDLLSKFSEWDNAFSSFLRDKNSEQQLLLLQIHHKTAFTVLQCCLNAEETAYDLCHPQFRDIVDLSTSVNSRCLSKVIQSTPQHSFSSLETGIIQPLCWTVMKCRDGLLRRRALAQLQICPQEGIWIAEIQARVAERVVEIEELVNIQTPMSSQVREVKLCSDIPEFLRIHGVDLTFHKPERRIRMTYERRLNGSDGEWDSATEWLSW